jgi:hypothetical protein
MTSSEASSAPHRVHEQDRETAMKDVRSSVGRDFHPAAASPDFGSTAGFGGELINSREIVFLKIGVFLEDLRLGHSGAEPSENVPYRDAQTPHARFSATFAWLNRNPCDRRWHFLLVQYDTLCIAVRLKLHPSAPPMI